MKKEKKEIPIEIRWIKKNKAKINLSALEKEMGMRHNTLWGFFKGERTLAEHWHPQLIKWVREFITIA